MLFIKEKNDHLQLHLFSFSDKIYFRPEVCAPLHHARLPGVWTWPRLWVATAALICPPNVLGAGWGVRPGECGLRGRAWGKLIKKSMCASTGGLWLSGAPTLTPMGSGIPMRSQGLAQPDEPPRQGSPQRQTPETGSSTQGTFDRHHFPHQCFHPLTPEQSRSGSPGKQNRTEVTVLRAFQKERWVPCNPRPELLLDFDAKAEAGRTCGASGRVCQPGRRPHTPAGWRGAACVPNQGALHWPMGRSSPSHQPVPTPCSLRASPKSKPCLLD